MKTLILSPQEKTVLLLRAVGKTTGQIARQLHCSPGRVEDYIKETHDKVRAIIGENNSVTCPMALSLAMISGEITCIDLLKEFHAAKLL